MENEIVFREEMKPLWQRIIAAILYTILVYFILIFIIDSPIAFTKVYVKSFVNLVQYGTIIIFTALPLSLTRNHYFDFNNKKYKLEFTIGYLYYGKWKPLPQLDYISVFKKKEGFFEINLWDNKNNHFNIYNYFEYNDAINMGYLISEKLEIDLLDASMHHDFKWVDKNFYKENGKVQYL